MCTWLRIFRTCRKPQAWTDIILLVLPDERKLRKANPRSSCACQAEVHSRKAPEALSQATWKDDGMHMSMSSGLYMLLWHTYTSVNIYTTYLYCLHTYRNLHTHKQNDHIANMCARIWEAIETIFAKCVLKLVCCSLKKALDASYWFVWPVNGEQKKILVSVWISQNPVFIQTYTATA